LVGIVEEAPDRIYLIRRMCQCVEALPEDLRPWQGLHLPGDVLASDQDALVFPVEAMEGMNMGKKNFTAPRHRHGCRQLAMLQEMGDFPEDPGTSLCGAADHHSVGAGV